jgi:hypothetical protein
MSLVTNGLINQLDAQYIQDVGEFTDGQNVIGAFLPDPVDQSGWYGSNGYGCVFLLSANNFRPALRFSTGVISPMNINKYLTYSFLKIKR